MRLSTVDRKNFLRIVGVAGSGLALGLEMAPASAAAAKDFAPVAWVRMSTDGTTTVIINQSEMGQAITTGLSMLVADELDIPFSTVRFEISPTAPAYYNPRWHGIQTGGSQSTPSMGPIMRKAGATARAMIVAAAAKKWNVSVDSLKTSDGIVSGPNGQRAKYTDLLELAATQPVPTDVKLKTPDQFKIIGTRVKRLDLKPKTNGTAVYGLDVKVPGMHYASIEKPLEIGAKVASFDASDALKVPGVVKVVQVSSGVAVVATNTWAAFKGRKALKVQYAPGPNANRSTDDIYAQMREMVKTPGGVVKQAGDITAGLATGTIVTANYETPYLSHAPMEPMNTTADVRADGVTLWTPTQAQTNAQKAAAKVTGLPLEKIVVNTTFLGGGFGRRGEDDFIIDAVETSKAAGVPVKLVWTREDDIRNDQFRPGTVHALSASLTADAKVSGYKHTLANSSILGRALPFLMKGNVDPLVSNGSADMPYALPNLLVDYHRLNIPIDVGFWRAPYANSNTFATESFIDELAHAAGKDPVAFRLSLMEPGSRPGVVMERAAKLANWSSAPAAGRARGVALASWDGGWVAVVTEISMPNNKLKIHRMVASVDVGMPINIDGLEQQISGAMVYGISAALEGKITFKNGVPQQSNFNNYRVLHMADSPEFVVDIVRNTLPPVGAGEVGTPCVAPALGNAIFALTGKRVRTLPLMDSFA
jgi:isoquinoline 1-oxidoreductase beta subunit